MVYLYKIHGSVNWIDNGETEGRFFSIEETSGNCTTKDNKRYSNYNFNVKLVRCFNYDTLLLS